MRTTVDVSDALLADAKREAARRGVPLRTLVEEGLRHELAAAETRSTSFRLRDGSFHGRGMNPEFAYGGWDTIRDTIYAEYGA